MTNETIMQFLLNLVLVYICAMAIIHEKQLIRFERKIWKYIKAFLKAVYYKIIKKEVE